MRFVILPCLQGDTYIAYPLTLCKSPQIVWCATLFGVAWRSWTKGQEWGGGRGRTGKNGSCMTWSVPSGSTPSFHTDPVHSPQCSATAATASATTTAASTATTTATGAQLFEAFGREMGERWLLETALPWTILHRLHSYMNRVIQVQWVHCSAVG